MVLTGQQDEAVGAEAVALGAQDFLCKADMNRALLHKAIRYSIERHRFYRTIEFERRQLLSVFDSISEVIYVSDVDTYEILFMNEHGKRLFGKDPIEGICYVELRDLDAPCPFCTNKYVRDNAGKPYEWEHHNLVLKGDYHITDQLVRWPDGRDVKLEVAIDITERKKIGAKLKEQTRLLTALMESIPLPVFYKDTNHVYMGCNHGFRRSHGPIQGRNCRKNRL